MIARALLAASLLAACGGTPPPVEEHRFAAAATVALAQVPAGVSCVVVEADGPTRSTSTALDVAPAGATSFALRGLPEGAVMFTAYAWGAPCAATAGKRWSWFSDRQKAQVGGATAPVVSLTMYR